jgi:hypothetical protein
LLARRAAQGLAARLPASAFPVCATELLASQQQRDEAAQLWLALHAAAEGAPPPGLAAPEPPTREEATSLWPLDGESPGSCCTRESPGSAESAGSGAEPPGLARGGRRSLRVSEPFQLLHKKGDFVRAVCVNALNSRQLAVSLGKGVLQLETVEVPQLQPYSPGGALSAPGPQSQWTAWGQGVKNTALQAPATPAGRGEQTEVVVQQSSGSDLTARCLCAHPKLPLYLAGGDSVVQCWQFGQTIQGQGLRDHLRAQYKLLAGGRVASMRISPCGEQFASIDTSGFLSLWRFGSFQSGSDTTLPFSRLACHSRRGTGDAPAPTQDCAGALLPCARLAPSAS